MLRLQVSLLLFLLGTAGCGMTPSVGEEPVVGTTATTVSPAATTTTATLEPEETASELATATTAPATATIEPATATAEPATATDEPTTETVEPPTQTDTPAATETAPPAATAGQPAGAIYVRSGSRIMAQGSAQPQIIDLQGEGEPIGPGPVEIAPDGSYIAYTVSAPGRIGLELLNIQTAEKQFVPDVTFGAPFSPDSRSLVYSIAGLSDWQLLARDLQSDEARVLQAGQGTGALRPITWTPAGILAEEILMFSDAPPQGLVLVEPAGGTAQPIRTEDHIQAVSTLDGSKVALVTGRLGLGEPGVAGLAILDVETGDEVVVVPETTGLIPGVRWSPDGSRLIYSSTADYDTPVTSLHLIAADGSDGRKFDLAEAGVAGTLRDIAWRDDATLLLLVADGAGQLHLYELSAETLDAAGMQEIGAFEQAGQGQQDQLLLAR